MAQMPTVEINIADFIKDYKEEETDSINDFEKKLRNNLVENVENKTWIYHPSENEGIKKLCERNRELEIEYQQNRIKILKEQEERKSGRNSRRVGYKNSKGSGSRSMLK